MNQKALEEYGFITKDKSQISYINPAPDVDATFFSEGDFSGESKEITNNPRHGVVNVKFPRKARSNDNVKSLKMTSTAKSIPEDCDALEKIVKENMPKLPAEEKGVIEDGIDQVSGSEGR